ncbi:MAG: flavodoxin family protein [Candidatus Omnitrophota bacterium]
MKVVAFNGSPRKKGNTFQLLQTVLNEIEAEGIETELVQLSGSRLQGCIACYGCKANPNERCAVDDDALNDYVQKMIHADGIILGSPTYFRNVTAEMKALIDRAGFVARANDSILRRKVGAAVVAVRRAGALPVFNAINDFFFIQQMVVPGSTYWNLGQGRDEGDVASDEEGMKNMVNLGQNVAWLLKKIR